MREIGRTTTIDPLCINVVVHANAAIGAALHNDESLTGSVAYLKTVDLESNDLKRTQGIHRLEKESTTLRRDAETGLSEITRLRELAKRTTDPNVKAELTAFADALGGALYRQKKAAVDLQRMIVIIEGHESLRETARDIKQTNEDKFRSRGQLPDATAFDDNKHGPNINTQAVLNLPQPTPAGLERIDFHYSAIAKEAAKSLEAMVPEILSDESVAAGHTNAAVSGC